MQQAPPSTECPECRGTAAGRGTHQQPPCPGRICCCRSCCILTDHGLPYPRGSLRWGRRSFKWRWRAIALATAGCALPAPCAGRRAARLLPYRSGPSLLPIPHLHGLALPLPAVPGESTSGSTRVPVPTSLMAWSPGRCQVRGSHPGAPQSLGVFAPLEPPAAQVHSGCFECKLDIAARAAGNNICTVNRQTVILINR